MTFKWCVLRRLAAQNPVPGGVPIRHAIAQVLLLREDDHRVARTVKRGLLVGLDGVELMVDGGQMLLQQGRLLILCDWSMVNLEQYVTVV